MDDGNYVVKVKAVVTAQEKVLLEIVENQEKGKTPLLRYEKPVEGGLVDAYKKGIEGNEICVEIKDNVVIKIL